MNTCPENVKKKINSIIEEMSDKHWLFSSNPGHDFMRQSLVNGNLFSRDSGN